MLALEDEVVAQAATPNDTPALEPVTVPQPLKLTVESLELVKVKMFVTVMLSEAVSSALTVPLSVAEGAVPVVFVAVSEAVRLNDRSAGEDAKLNVAVVMSQPSGRSKYGTPLNVREPDSDCRPALVQAADRLTLLIAMAVSSPGNVIEAAPRVIPVEVIVAVSPVRSTPLTARELLESLMDAVLVEQLPVLRFNEPMVMVADPTLN